jgi:hypothetical protein
MHPIAAGPHRTCGAGGPELSMPSDIGAAAKRDEQLWGADGVANDHQGPFAITIAHRSHCSQLHQS